VLEKQGNLLVGQSEKVFRNPLLMGPLVPDPQLLEPSSYPGRMPSVAISRNMQLEPRTAAGSAIHLGPQAFLGGTTNNFGVFLTRRGIAQGLPRDIAPIPDQVTEECDSLFGPFLGRFRLGEVSG